MAGWNDEQWESLIDGSACWTCADGPAGIVVAERETVWVTTDRRVTCRGYVGLFLKRHAVELFELDDAERTAFFRDVATVASAIDTLFHPVKINYELHGNTNPHLHLHVFPRYRGDPYEDGPIRGSDRNVTHSDGDVEGITDAVRNAFRRP